MSKAIYLPQAMFRSYIHAREFFNIFELNEKYDRGRNVRMVNRKNWFVVEVHKPAKIRNREG